MTISSERPSSTAFIMKRAEPPALGPKFTRTTRFTQKYCAFWYGPLSNWHVGATFSGKRCMELLLPRLDEHLIPHPSPDAFSTRLIASHLFICGEQFMMAAKAWVFEGNLEMAKTSMSEVPADEIQAAVSHMIAMAAPSANTSLNSRLTPSAFRQMYFSTLPKILRATHPGDQKALGREVNGFRQNIWEQFSHHAVVAGCIARAERDSDLRAVYLNIGNRKFVEGSPQDVIWGVGMKFDDPRIDDEKNWRGENRLGQCHDEAARFTREMAGSVTT